MAASTPPEYPRSSAVRPDECYHLASRLRSDASRTNSIASPTIHRTHSLRRAQGVVPECRATSRAAARCRRAKAPQNEATPFNPRSVYGISKLAAFHLARNYREHHRMFVSAGILYNHESPRRGHQFVTRKISSTVAMIKLGRAQNLSLGNIDARRDWGYGDRAGHARDVAERRSR